MFGKWGDGKTTVLRFSEQMLKDSSNVVFWFSPWSVGCWQDIWDDFGSALFEALSAAGVKCDDSWKKWLKDKAKWVESSGAGEVAEATVGLYGGAKIYASAFRLVSHVLRYDGSQIRAIREKLGGNRVVVLIDDLDRCAPELLPRLLMSLREILDLPGFTFVLAFDDEIVSRALTSVNTAHLSLQSRLRRSRICFPTIQEN